MTIKWEDRRYTDKRGDYRTPYERDYARIVHSASFRRLQAKTQVLGVGDGDFYRTRLTHTLEVSQIGVSITKRLYREAKRRSSSCLVSKAELAELEAKMAILPDPMLMSSICLAHDIGHPPFGHGGEVALNRCMLPYGGFEGNGQTLRIITKLDRYHEKGGMNLTKRTVLGTIKYPVRFSDAVNWNLEGLGVRPKTKTDLELVGERYLTHIPDTSIFVAEQFKPPKCYLDDEHEDVVLGWVGRGLENDWPQLSMTFDDKPGKKHPKPKFMSLDTSIMELADDIAYGVHDLEDAIGLGLIDENAFRTWLDSEDNVHRAKRSELLRPYFYKCSSESQSLPENPGKSLDRMVAALFLRESHDRKAEISNLVGFFVNAAHLKLDEHTNELKLPPFKHQIFRWKATLPKDYKNALGVLRACLRRVTSTA